MTENFTIDNLILAIQFLTNRKEDNKVKFKEAETFLKTVEKSKSIWIKSHELLMMPNLDASVYFFAAKFLKSKLQYDFVELSPQDYNPIFQNIIGYLGKFTQKAVKSELYLAFSYLYIRTYEIFGNLLEFLYKAFPSTNTQLSTSILETLEVLADEDYYENVVIESDNKKKYFTYLSKEFQSKVILLLDQSCKNLGKDVNDQKYKYIILKCFANWIALEGSDEILFQIPNLTITELAFNALDSPELMERGVSCLCNFIKRISSLEACQPLFEFALEKVLALFPQFKVFVKEELIDEEREFIDIFVTFGKRFLNQLMNYENEKSFMFFQQMFEMTFLENSSSREDFIKYWLRFCSKINEKSEEQKAIYIAKFKNFLLELGIHLVSSLKYTAAELSSINTLALDTSKKNEKDEDGDDDEYDIDYDEKDEIQRELNYKKNERKNASDLLKEIVIIIDFQTMIFPLANNIQKACSTVQNKEDWESWALIEANLFGIMSIIKYIGENDVKYIYDILNLIMHIPFNSFQLKKTCVGIIKESARHIKNEKDLIKKLFAFLLQNFEINYINHKIFQAFNKLCTHNPEIILENISDFLTIYQKHYDEDLIIEGIAKAVGTCQDLAKFSVLLSQICQPFAKILLGLYENYEKSLIESKEVFDKKFFCDQVCFYLDKLTLIITNIPELSEKSTQDTHPVQDIYKEFWPFIQILCEKFDTEPQIIEKCCRFIKHSMRCLGRLFNEYLMPLFELIHKQYEKKAISSYLYLVEVSVTVFGTKLEYSEILRIIYEFMCERTLKELPKLKDFEENPYLTEDFFGMMGRFVKYAPHIALNSKTLQIALQLAEIGIGVKHIEVAKTIYMFIENLVSLCNEKKGKFSEIHMLLKVSLAENFGKTFVIKLIKTMEEVPVSSIREYVLDLLLEIIGAFTKESHVWFQEALSLLPNDILTLSEKNSILENISLLKISDIKENLIHLQARCKQSYHRSKHFDV